MFTKFRIALFALLAVAACLAWTAYSRAVSYQYLTNVVTVQAASANGAATQITATISGVSGRMTYLEGFDVTGLGATAAGSINITVTGTANTLTYTLQIPSGVTAALTNGGLFVRFPTPIPSSAQNTNIVVTVPTFGSGNTQASVVAYGFTL